MKIRYEENNSLEINQTKKPIPEKIKVNGREYTYVGKTKENPSILTRVKAFGECVIMTLAGCFIIPCFFKSFRKTFKIVYSELLSGQEIVRHYVINTGVFTKKNNKPPTDKELYEKGFNASQNAIFD